MIDSAQYGWPHKGKELSQRGGWLLRPFPASGRGKDPGTRSHDARSGSGTESRSARRSRLLVQL
jgi:hypothetical protein